jgi:hypothetical protein
MLKVQRWISLAICCGCVSGPLLGDDPIPSKKFEATDGDAKRFDLVVREEIFAGFGGDEEALKRGESKCEKALTLNPKNAEAMVWLGAVKVFKAGGLFGRNKPLEAFPLWTSGLKSMDDAVKLDPDNVGVRIPRASVLLPAARNTPPAMSTPLLKTVLADFEYIYKKQVDHLDSLGTHPRGELRMGLADTYRLLGKLDSSKEQLEAIAKELPDTEYATRAKEWLAAEPTKKLAHNCLGCHTN